MEWLNDLGNALQGAVPEIKTDVGTDIDTAIKANSFRLGTTVFIAMLLAFIIGSLIVKRIG